jgi:hypothetical protein
MKFTLSADQFSIYWVAAGVKITCIPVALSALKK